MATNETTSTKDLRTLRGMLWNVVSDPKITSYDELVRFAGLSRRQLERLPKNYPSFFFVLRLMLDFNQAEAEQPKGDDDG